MNVSEGNWHESSEYPGVRFFIRQISFSSRLELMAAMRDLIAKNEFLRAGDSLDQTDAAISDLLARSVYLRWGLQEIQGITVAGQPADSDLLIEKGPERLCNEIVEAIRASLELSETERKNS